MVRFVLSLSFFLVGLAGFAQDNPDNLQRLLDEREQLTMEYQYYNNQNSNFWGKKSKKDLLHIVESLKKIINKDSEIIKEINLANLKTKAKANVESGQIKRQVFNEQLLFQDNLYQLKQELANLQNHQKVKQREFNNMQEQLQVARKSKQDAEKLMALAGGFCLILLVYIFVLRSKIPRSKGGAGRTRK